MLTLSILSFVSLLHTRIETTPLPLIFVIGLSCIAIGLAVAVHRNPQVTHLLRQGWWPLFAAMIISNGTGLLLDTFVSRYQGYALIAVVITGTQSHPQATSRALTCVNYLGLPGSIGAIFVSRLSTAFHAAAITILPSVVDRKPHPSARLVMTTLLVVGFPIQLVFLAFIYMFGWVHLPFVFVAFEVLFYLIAVCAVPARPHDLSSSLDRDLGGYRSHSCEGYNRVLLEMGLGPRHVRTANPLCADGRRWPVLARRMLRGRLAAGREGAVIKSIVPVLVIHHIRS